METKQFFLKHRVIIAITALLIPVSVVFSWIAATAIRQIEGQIAQANHSSLLLYHNILQNEILSTEKFLGNVVYGSPEFEQFARSIEDNEVELAGTQLSELFKAAFEDNSDIAALVWFHSKTGRLQIRFNTIVSYENIEPEVQELVKEQAEQADVPLGWYLIRGSRHYYLCRTVQRNGGAVMGIYSLEQAVKNASIFYGQKGELVFFQQDRVLANEKFLNSIGQSLTYQPAKDYYFLGSGRQYLVVQEHMINFKIALIEPYNDTSGSIGLLYISPFLYTAAALLTFLIVIKYLEEMLFSPLADLVKTMEKIQQGDLTARLAKQKGEEFSKVEITFNSMITELSTLRIKSYEQQLEMNRAELSALRMQIRPHFYLNCLKSIFGLAQSGENKTIQQAILSLSSHLRYVMDINTNSIPLEKELEMCENYITLQQQCGYVNSQIKISYDTAIAGLKVPPVSILTLVENSVKHGSVPDGTLLVKIRAKLLEADGQKLADIIVSDNGPGFSEEMLAKLNDNLEEHGGYRVGLPNVIKQFRLMYKEGSMIRFYNASGAAVEILLTI